MLFEIVNPSDTYTIKSDDLELAAIACCLLGQGQYALDGIDCQESVPMFLFGGEEEWFTEKFGSDFTTSLTRVLETRSTELADCMDSVIIGGSANRQSYEKGLELIDDPDKKAKWRDHWHDERRSSMNDIGGRAWKWAEKIRSGSVEVNRKQ